MSYCADKHMITTHTDGRTDTQTDTGNYNTRMPTLASGNKTQDSCGVMFGEVKLAEADYTVIWETLLFMSSILCQISWKRPFEAYSLFKAFCSWKMWKTFATNVLVFFCEYDKTRDSCWLTCLTLHLHLSLKNESRNAKIYQLIQWPIMRISNEAEPP